MADMELSQNHTGVNSFSVTIKDLLSTVIKGNIVVASSESTSVETESGLDRDVLAVVIKLIPQSTGFAFFQQQLADAVSFWDSVYAERLKNPPGTDLPDPGIALEPFWAHTPQERVLLVFDGIEHVQSGPVYDFLYELVNYPLENMTLLLLTPTDSVLGMRMDPQDISELEQAADWIAKGQLCELESFFVQRGVRYTSPELTRQYLQLFRRIPEEAFALSPALQIMQAGMLSVTGQVEKAYHVLQRAGMALETGELSAEQRWLLGEIYLLQSLLNTSLGVCNPLEQIKMADRMLPGGSHLITRHTGMCLGNNRALFYPGFEKQSVYRILDIMHEAAPYMLRLTGGFGHGRHYLAATEVYYYTDQLQKAKSSAYQALSRAGEYEQWDLQCCTHGLLMRVSAAQGDYRQAVKHIKKMKECRLRYGEKEQKILFLPDLSEAEFYLAIGEGQLVAPWLLEEARSENAEPLVFAGSLPLIRATCLMESGNLLEALDATEKALQRFIKYKHYLLALQSYILKAVLYDRFGELDLAIMHIRRAHEMEASNDLIMMYAEYGKHMAALMARVRNAQGHDIPHEWIDRVLSRSEIYSRNLGHLRTTYLAIESGDTTPGHLTRREQEAMELLCEGLSNQQIADRMDIKITSLKTNMHRIYRKLGAKNRTDAVRLWLMSKK